MESLAATYEWKKPTASEPGPASTLSASGSNSCRCAHMSPAEQEVQELKAKAELVLLRDRVRKACDGWLGEPQFRRLNPNVPRIRFEWQIDPKDLSHRLCYWQHTSALSRVGLTPCLAEVVRLHRKQEGATPEPPASKNKLILVIWNLAATVQVKLQQWASCVSTNAKETFTGTIVVRTSDLIPIWLWEADVIRKRPALTTVCDRMLSLELFRYRQQCHQLTSQEKKCLARSSRGGERAAAPYLTPFGLQWPPSPDSAAAAGDSSAHQASPGTLPSFRAASQTTLQAASTPGVKKVFAGDTFCVSGEFSIGQKELLALIRDHGGAIAPTANRSCTFVVAESIGSEKTKRAVATGIPIVTEAWVHTSIAQGRKATDPSLFLNVQKRPASKNATVDARSNVSGEYHSSSTMTSDSDESELDDSSDESDSDALSELQGEEDDESMEDGDEEEEEEDRPLSQMLQQTPFGMMRARAGVMTTTVKKSNTEQPFKRARLADDPQHHGDKSMSHRV